MTLSQPKWERDMAKVQTVEMLINYDVVYDSVKSVCPDISSDAIKHFIVDNGNRALFEACAMLSMCGLLVGDRVTATEAARQRLLGEVTYMKKMHESFGKTIRSDSDLWAIPDDVNDCASTAIAAQIVATMSFDCYGLPEFLMSYPGRAVTFSPVKIHKGALEHVIRFTIAIHTREALV